ncbi:MAG TPA: PDZ domain-containing protein [Chloroflexaceae bacterium]|nr:PDZ domain-containing protein [Chloroflexaceae bacterium]
MTATDRFRLAALAVLVIILGAVLLLWPVPSLGLALDLQTGTVRTIQPGSPAARAGVQPGDRITSIYGYPWQAVNTRLLLIPLPWSADIPTPMTVVHEGVARDLVAWAGVPDGWLQVEKALRALIALTCWWTGYLLGRSPRATDWRLRWTAWFWVILGGSLGLYQLTIVVSYPLTIAVLWVQCSVLAPVAVAIHHWYPLRPTSPVLLGRVWRVLSAAIIAGQVGLLGLVLASPATTVVFERLDTVVTYVYLASIILSAVTLWHAYRTTVIAHVRRQIRLIGAACMLVGCWWALLVLLGWGNASLQALIPPAAFPFGAVLIPLAYLLSGVSADLMRIDQLVRRLLVHALTALTLLGFLVAGVQSQQLIVTPALALLMGLVLYVPLFRLVQRWVVPGARDMQASKALREAGKNLGTSLDATRLVSFLSDGIRQAYLNPPLAIYHRSDPEAAILVRIVAESLDMPAVIPGALFDPWRQQGTQLLSASALQERLGQAPLEAGMAELLFHPTVALWGIIRQQQGAVLGLVVIGPRGDDDPYQSSDLRELEQLLETAALAFTNSASYDAQVVAQTMIRALYRQAQQAEERTAAEIANEIHDEVMSIHLRYNMDMLERLIADLPTPEVRERLGTVLAGEEAMGQMLRLICERLKPTGIDQPLGLPASLRQQTTGVQSRWSVPTTLTLEHEPVPLDEQVRRALIRITREALSNAVRHGRPTAIQVSLRFPVEATDPLVLMIRNDGEAPPQEIVPVPGHWGVRNMREYAEAVGATIRWTYPEAGGTCVTVVVPAEVITRGVVVEPPLATLPTWAGRRDEDDLAVAPRAG